MESTHDTTSVEDHLRNISASQTSQAKLTILSASMTVCRRWATVKTVTSDLDSSRSDF